MTTLTVTQILGYTLLILVSAIVIIFILALFSLNKKTKTFKNFNQDDFDKFFENFYKKMNDDLNHLQNYFEIPTESFQFLGLSTNATKNDVQKRYYELSKIYHPDAGGSHEKFIKLTEAKNKCLNYIK